MNMKKKKNNKVEEIQLSNLARLGSLASNDWLSELTRMNRLKFACKGFLFYLNHNELVHFSSLAKIQRLTSTYVSVIFGKKENNLNDSYCSCFLLPEVAAVT